MDYMIYSSQKNFVTGDATMNASFMLSPPLINKSLGYLSLWVGGWLEVALNAVWFYNVFTCLSYALHTCMYGICDNVTMFNHWICFHL